MKNILTQFSRLFVGILFIISGLIKLNDPVGFSYKLAEYFSEPVFNMPFFRTICFSNCIVFGNTRSNFGCVIINWLQNQIHHLEFINSNCFIYLFDLLLRLF